MKKIIIILSVLILIILSVIWLRPKESPYQNKLKPNIELCDNNSIINNSRLKYLTEIFDRGFKIAGINDKKIIIEEIPIVTNMEDGRAIMGSVTQKKDHYVIYMTRMSTMRTIKVAAHEIIHIQQMVNGDFERSGPKKMRWKNEYYNFPYTTEYLDRPWEQDAIKKTSKLAELMNEELLLKK